MEHIEHMALPVTDIKGALTWYQSMFDFNVTYADQTWAVLQFSNISVVLVLLEQHPPHIAVKRKDAHTYRPVEVHRDGTSSTYIKDPWNNSIEVMFADIGPLS